MTTSEESKQGENQGETGSVQNAARVGLQASLHWFDRATISTAVFRAICELSLESPDQAGEGFQPQEILERINRQGRAKGSAAKDDVARYIRSHWKALGRKWPSYLDGLKQTAHELHLDCVPMLDVIQGGGAGNPSKYRVLAEPLSEEETNDKRSITELKPGEVRYFEPEVSDAPRWVNLVIGGDLRDWHRRWVYLSIVITTIVSLVLLGWLLIAYVTIGHTTPRFLANVWGLLVIGSALWYSTGPLYNVIFRRVVRAPWWMQDLEASRVLEARFPPRHKEKRIALVRYAASCPVEGCGGEITIKGGWPERTGRLLGRCEEAPRSHVYSFDHVTRIGHRIDG